jgi:hypothetical protein
MRFAAAAALLALAGGWYYSQPPEQRPAVPEQAPGPRPSWPTGSNIATQYRPEANAARNAPAAQWRSGERVTLQATVSRLLADDRSGSRHQRFIIRTDSGATLLIAHNIDLAPRLDGLALGDRLLVSGEYEWNQQGGLLHWTHHDPSGRHRPGYIEWKGRRYE